VKRNLASSLLILSSQVLTQAHQVRTKTGEKEPGSLPSSEARQVILTELTLENDFLFQKAKES
jgi:hypothetical protein